MTSERRPEWKLLGGNGRFVLTTCNSSGLTACPIVELSGTVTTGVTTWKRRKREGAAQRERRGENKK